MQAAATHAFVQRMPSLGIVRDAIRGGQHLDEETIAQTWRLRFVPVDGLVQFNRGHLPGGGPSRPILGNNVAQVFDREIAAAIGGEALTCLLRPQPIDVRVRSVEAIGDIFHERDAIPRLSSRACSPRILAFSFIVIPLTWF